MIRSITSSTFAATMSLPPSTELPGPKNSRSGPKSAVWVGNKFLLPMAGDANSVTPMEQVDGALESQEDLSGSFVPLVLGQRRDLGFDRIEVPTSFREPRRRRPAR